MPSFQYQSEFEYLMPIIDDMLIYNALTGVFVWKKSPAPNVRVGDVAGTNNKGYIKIKLKGKIYPAHRLAWYAHYRHPIVYEIDHINRQKDDNRIVNLRDVPHKVNNANSSGHIDSATQSKGITYNDRYALRFAVRLHRDGKCVLYKRFATKQEAIEAVQSFEKEEQSAYAPIDT